MLDEMSDIYGSQMIDSHLEISEKLHELIFARLLPFNKRRDK